MQNAMEVEVEVEVVRVCEADTNFSYTDLDAQRPTPTDLELVRQQYEEQQNSCATLLAEAFAERAQVRQELMEVRMVIGAKFNGFQIAQNNCETVAKDLSAAEQNLAQLRDRFMTLQEELHAALIWQPSVVKTDDEIQALTLRVEKLRSEKQRRMGLDDGEASETKDNN